jgi:PAS domain S-box-containing protein
MSETTFDGGRDRPEGATRLRGAGTDLILVLLAAVCTFLVAGTFELSEAVGRWLRHFEPYQLDELPAAVTVLVLGLGWSSWRQSRQAATEMGLRLQAQESLNRQRAYLEVLFNENLSANLIAAGDGGITVANPELAHLFGLDAPKAVVGRRLGDFYADEALWRGHREILSGGGRVEMNDLRIRRADGAEAVVIARLTARRAPEGLEVHAFFTDVTALETTRRELAVALDENRRLAQRGIEMLEHERRNIARELHDEMGQWLNALKLDAVSIRGRDDVPVEVKDVAQSIVELTDHVYDVARSLMRRLRPVALDELGLGPAIQYCVDQWRRRHPAVKCEVRIDGVPDSLGEAANITLYRMVQEGLTNVTKHAQASVVTVALTAEADAATGGVRVDIVDDGVGLDEQIGRSGLGLPGLRERVEMLGGRFWVDSAPGRGTALHASLPGALVGAEK